MKLASLVVAGLLASASGVVVACSEPPPEAKLEDAGEDLAEARGATRDARDQLEEVRMRLSEAEDDLRDARRAARAAQDRELTAEERLQRRATDVALFRYVQGGLLELETLAGEAVTVRVDDGVVTLDGSVSNQGSRDAAVALATAAPGVKAVRDHMDLESD